MTTLSNPKQIFSISPASEVVQNGQQRVLFVGQMKLGTAISGQLNTNIQNDNSWDTLFGAKSMLAGAIRRAREVNGVTRFDAIGLVDDIGPDPQATITITGTATEKGTLTVIVGSKSDYSFTISVEDGDTETVVGDAIVAAITANTNVPMLAANVAGVVTLTYIHNGTEGNATTLAISGLVAGITSVFTAFTGGTVNPNVSTLFDVVEGIRYQTVVAPFAWGISYLTDFLDPRFNFDNKILDGVAIITTVDTFANLEAVGNSQDNRNLVIFGDLLTNNARQKGASIIELPFVESAEIGALRALRLTQDANIADIITANGQLDTIGGPAIASLPYFNTPLARISVADINTGFSEQEVSELLTAGISVIGNNIVNSVVLLGQVVTTYKTDSAGNPDVTFKFLNYVDTGSNVREFMFNNGKRDFSQTRLTAGDTIALRAMVNTTSLKSDYIKYYEELRGPNFVLVAAGEAALQFFKNNFNISTDLPNGKVFIEMQVIIIVQLRELIINMKIAFNI